MGGRRRAAQDRYATHELFAKGRFTTYVRYSKVDLEARCEIERIPGSSPQRILLVARRLTRQESQAPHPMPAADAERARHDRPGPSP